MFEYKYFNGVIVHCIDQLRLCRDLSVSNGWVEYDTPYIPGRVASISCSPGYTLIGTSKRTCTNRGWSGSSSYCACEYLNVCFICVSGISWNLLLTVVMCGVWGVCACTIILHRIRDCKPEVPTLCTYL